MSKRNWLFWLSMGILCFGFIYLIRGVLLPFVVGILVAYLLDPLTDKLENRGLSRTIATTLIIGAFFLSVLLICMVIPPVIAEQAAGLLAAVPEYASTFSEKYGDKISHWLGLLQNGSTVNVEQAATDASTVLLTFIENFVAKVFQSSLFVINLLGLLLITPVVAFYLLRDWDVLMARIDALLPRAHAPVIREQIHIIDQTLAGFMRGQFNVCLLLAAYYGIGLSLAGLQFGFVIGILSGLLVILPYVGFAFGFIVGMGVAFFQFGGFMATWPIFVIFMVGQALESYILTPSLVGGKVGLHPLWIIFGLLAGGALFGFLGILLAVPVSAVIGVLIRFSLKQYLSSGYYQGK